MLPLCYIIDLLLCYSYSGSLDGFSLVASMLGFTCQAVFPTFAPCLEHVCAGGGGSVANEGLGLYIEGDYSLRLECYVTCKICRQTSCHGGRVG